MRIRVLGIFKKTPHSAIFRCPPPPPPHCAPPHHLAFIALPIIVVLLFYLAFPTSSLPIAARVASN